MGECFGLRVSNVDMLRGVLHVRQQITSDGRITPPKSPSSVRTLPMPERVRAAVAEHLQRWPSTGRVFPCKRETYSAAFRLAARRAGLDVTPHDLRHAFASHLLAQSVSVPTVQRLLGHESPAITLSTYSHAIPGGESVAVRVMDALMAQGH